MEKKKKPQRVKSITIIVHGMGTTKVEYGVPLTPRIGVNLFGIMDRHIKELEQELALRYP